MGPREATVDKDVLGAVGALAAETVPEDEEARHHRCRGLLGKAPTAHHARAATRPGEPAEMDERVGRRANARHVCGDHTASQDG